MQTLRQISKPCVFGNELQRNKS